MTDRLTPKRLAELRAGQAGNCSPCTVFEFAALLAEAEFAARARPVVQECLDSAAEGECYFCGGERHVQECPLVVGGFIDRKGKALDRAIAKAGENG